jgi:hypothetical protein
MIDEQLKGVLEEVGFVLRRVAVGGTDKITTQSGSIEIKAYKVGSNTTRIDIVEKK